MPGTLFTGSWRDRSVTQASFDNKDCRTPHRFIHSKGEKGAPAVIHPEVLVRSGREKQSTTVVLFTSDPAFASPGGTQTGVVMPRCPDLPDEIRRLLIRSWLDSGILQKTSTSPLIRSDHPQKPRP